MGRDQNQISQQYDSRRAIWLANQEWLAEEMASLVCGGQALTNEHNYA